jgi:Domain of unknown function (DUF4190)
MQSGDVVFTHTGHRYMLGYTADSYGIWDRQAPGPPVQHYPRTQEGWQGVWRQFSQLEPQSGAVSGPNLPTGQPYGYVQPPQTNGLAIASLVLGILWLFFVGSILALIFGYVSKGQIDESHGGQGGRGLAIAGIVLGWVGVGWFILALLLRAITVT